ncbi:MAG: hypothetical protein KC643_04825 [Nitrospira sp.]|nr:hypothetical protein [Nitrospira sp.]
MKFILVVFSVVLVLAILAGILDWYFWGRSPQERYRSTRIHPSSEPPSFSAQDKEDSDEKRT